MEPAIRTVVPILPVPDVKAALAWYQSALGAESAWEWGDPVSFGGCQLGNIAVHFGLVPEAQPGTPNLAMFLLVSGVNEIHQGIVGRGTAIQDALGPRPWGAEEFTVRDLNGVLLRFAEFGRPAPSGEPVPDLVVEERKLTLAEQQALYVGVGWAKPDDTGRLTETLITYVAMVGSEVVGAASVSGDRTSAFIVRDVMVLPDYQGRGVGRALVTRVMEWVRTHVPHGAHVTLLTGAGRTSFYEQFGFQCSDGDLVGMVYRA